MGRPLSVYLGSLWAALRGSRSLTPPRPISLLQRPLRVFLAGVVGTGEHQVAVLPMRTLCRHLVAKSEHYVFSPSPQDAGRIHSPLGNAEPPLCASQPDQRPGKEYSDFGFQRKHFPELFLPSVNKGSVTPLLQFPPQKGLPSQYSDREPESKVGVSGCFPTPLHGTQPCQSASSPFPKLWAPLRTGLLCLSQGAGQGLELTEAGTAKSGAAPHSHPGSPAAWDGERTL